MPKVQVAAAARAVVPCCAWYELPRFRKVHRPGDTLIASGVFLPDPVHEVCIMVSFVPAVFQSLCPRGLRLSICFARCNSFLDNSQSRPLSPEDLFDKKSFHNSTQIGLTLSDEPTEPLLLAPRPRVFLSSIFDFAALSAGTGFVISDLHRHR
jgi:hypothetical protein